MAPPAAQPPSIQPPSQPAEETSTDVAPSGQTPVKGGVENISVEAKSEEVTVDMAGFAFKPETVTIKVGDTVKWTNSDSASHLVESTNGPESFKSQSLPKGASFEYKFTKPGTYAYKCAIHPSMTGTVVVE